MHPGIVAVFDAGRNESGEPYLVMERVEGETLKERFSSSPATADRVPASSPARYSTRSRWPTAVASSIGT